MAIHDNNFGGLRLFSALLIMLNHGMALSGRPLLLIHGAYDIGSPGLFMLFAISGYLVTESWFSDPHLPRFLLRRILRLWPAYAVAVLACSALAGVIASSAAAGAFLSNLWLQRYDSYFFPEVLAYPMLNGSLWTMPLTVGWCVALGLSAFVLRRWLVPVLVLVVSLSMLGFWLLVTEAHGRWLLTYNLWTGFAHLGVFFCIGALLRAFTVLLTRRCTLGMAGLAAVLLLCGEFTLALWLGVPLLAVLAGRESWPLLRSATRHGDLSYGVYLYAWPVQQMVTRALGAATPYPVLLLCSVAITLALAFLSCHAVERRAMKLSLILGRSGPSGSGMSPRLAGA